MAAKLKLDKLQVGNQVYSLIALNGLIEDKQELYGMVNTIDQTLKYDYNRSKSLVEETLFHELLEIIKSTMSSCKFTELQMDTIARHIVQVLRQFNVDLATEVTIDETVQP